MRMPPHNARDRASTTTTTTTPYMTSSRCSEHENLIQRRALSTFTAPAPPAAPVRPPRPLWTALLSSWASTLASVLCAFLYGAAVHWRSSSTPWPWPPTPKRGREDVELRTGGSLLKRPLWRRCAWSGRSWTRTRTSKSERWMENSAGSSRMRALERKCAWWGRVHADGGTRQSIRLALDTERRTFVPRWSSQCRCGTRARSARRPRTRPPSPASPS